MIKLDRTFDRPKVPGITVHTMVAVTLFAAALLGVTPAFADECGNLTSLKIADTKILSAESVPADARSLSGKIALELKGLPAFCRVIAEVQPVKDSNIKLEVWMPVSGWNGTFVGHGNGGFAGYLAYGGMQQALLRGYATASTDTGHVGGAGDAEWAIGHPEKVIDYGYRGIHEMTVKAKLIVSAFYEKSPQYSYFSGCSNGGRAALMEAQRFPADYNGILAGAPASNWTYAMAGFLWDLKAMTATPGSQIPVPKLPTINTAVMRKCDAQDGLEDGIITDPRSCHFDPAELLCKDSDSDKCLTAAQVDAVRKVYSGVKDSHDNVLYPGFMPGDELGPGGWAGWLLAPVLMSSGQYLFGSRYYADMVFEDPKWDPQTFQVDRDLKISNEKKGGILNAANTDLTPFAKRGGKLILYQGWSDAAIAPLNLINYYDGVLKSVPLSSSPNGSSFIKLYMVPGMQHCGGGIGAVDFGQNDFASNREHNIFTNLERWVKKGVEPSAIVGWQHKDPAKLETEIIMKRPVCPYPEVPRYKGTGDVHDATSFECK